MIKFFKYFFALVSFCVIIVNAEAAFELAGDDIITLSLGGAGTARNIPGNGINSNPAAFGNILFPEISTSYRKLFNLEELQQNQISSKFRLMGGGCSLTFFDFGNKLYRENIFSIGYGIRLSAKISAGLNIPIYFLNIEGGGKMETIGIGGGILYNFSEKLNLGVNTNNVNTPEMGDSSERLPFIFEAGVSYYPAEQFCFNLDINKQDDFKIDRRFGIEYYGLKKMVLRTGIDDETAGISAGFEIIYKYFNIRYSFSSHKQLGFTNIFGILIRFRQIKYADN